MSIFFGKENLLVILIIIGLTLGSIMFYSASYLKSLVDYGQKDKIFLDFFKKVIIGGFFAFILGVLSGYFWTKTRWLLNLVFIFLFFGLLMLLIFMNAKVKRWIQIGGLSIQPAELIKPFIILFGVSIVSGLRHLSFSWRRMLSFWLPTLLTIVLILLQPALTNPILILTAMSVVYFSLKPHWKEIVFLFIIVLIIISSSFIWKYRLERFIAFLKPETEKSFQTNIVKSAIISGGILGKGLGGSTYKVAGIPLMLSDSIFGIIGEELGLIGSTFIILGFLFFYLYLIKLGNHINHPEGKIFTYGAVTLFSLQTFIHFAGNIGLIPLTGVVLPFFSAGGSAQIAFLFSVGLIKGFYERYS